MLVYDVSHMYIFYMCYYSHVMYGASVLYCVCALEWHNRQRRALEWHNRQRANLIAQNCPPVPPGARGDAGNTGKKPPPALPPASGSKPVPPTNCAPVSPFKAPRGDPPPQAQRILASVPPSSESKGSRAYAFRFAGHCEDWTGRQLVVQAIGSTAQERQL